MVKEENVDGNRIEARTEKKRKDLQGSGPERLLKRQLTRNQTIGRYFYEDIVRRS